MVRIIGFPTVDVPTQEICCLVSSTACISHQTPACCLLEQERAGSGTAAKPKLLVKQSYDDYVRVREVSGKATPPGSPQLPPVSAVWCPKRPQQASRITPDALCCHMDLAAKLYSCTFSIIIYYYHDADPLLSQKTSLECSTLH